MRKKAFPNLAVTLSIIVLTITAALSACSTPLKGNTMTPLGADRKFSGNSTASSGEFVITGQDVEDSAPKWAISWYFYPDRSINGSYTNYFALKLRQSENSSTSDIAPYRENVSMEQHEVVYFYDSGTFRFEIESSGGEWDIYVSDFSTH